MLNFLRRGRKPPALLKCVLCEHRPGQTYHNHIPLCRSCKTTLERSIADHGGAVVTGVEALQKEADPRRRAVLTEEVIDEAGKLVPYEDQHLKTILPEPTAVIHKVRAGETEDLVIHLYQEADA